MGLFSSRTAARQPRRSLSQDLTTKLILIVTITFTIATIGNYLFFSHRAKTLHEAKASEYLLYLANSLEVPLWNLDVDWIKSICDSFAKNETVALLRVSDETGERLFEFVLPEDSHPIRRAADIQYRNQFIGSVEIGLTSRIYKKSNHQMLFGSILTMLVVVLGLGFSTRMLLNRILKKPLHHLMARIDHISSGEYHQIPESLEHHEISTILDKFNAMAAEINQREHSLMESNQQLEAQITERNAAENALRESEARYRLLVEDLPVGLFRVTPETDGTYLMVNPAFVRMFGYASRDALIVQPARDLYRHPDMRRHVMAMIQHEETLQGLEIEFIKRDGSSLIGLVSAHMVRSSQGEPRYIDGIIEDISDRKKLESQIRQRQKMEAIGTLAGGIAHDFNNILSSIFGFTEAAKMQYARGNPIEAHLDEILSSGLRARSLIKQIMAFSRQSEMPKMATAVVPIVKETIKFLRASLPALIDIRQAIQVRDALVWADPTQIHQVLMNLCANAAHAMQTRGGMLEIILDEVTMDNEAVLEYGDIAGGTYLRLTVSDEGHGIRQEHIERIFEPFFTTKARGEGAGMGLAVIHGLIRDMGGAIRVLSKPDAGTTFNVLLPRYYGAASCAEPDFPAPAKGRARILFVDDEKGFLTAGAEILEQIGYRVTTADRGEDAVALFAADAMAFDLVITDLVMPGMTGLELVQRLRKMRPEIDIILCSGFSDQIMSINRKAAGIAGVVMKPLLAGELTRAIEEALQKKEFVDTHGQPADYRR